eukprot:707258_1
MLVLRSSPTWLNDPISSSGSESLLTRLRKKRENLRAEYASTSRECQSLKDKLVGVEPEFQDVIIDRLHKFGDSWKARHREQRVAHAHHASRVTSLEESASQKRHEIFGVESEIDALQRSLVELLKRAEVSSCSQNRGQLSSVAVQGNCISQPSTSLLQTHDRSSSLLGDPQNAVKSETPVGLLPCRQSDRSDIEPDGVDQIDFEVDRILGERVNVETGRSQFYILWKANDGRDSFSFAEEKSWVDESDLLQCEEIVQKLRAAKVKRMETM